MYPNIIVWAWEHTPETIQALVQDPHDVEWVAIVPPIYADSVFVSWFDLLHNRVEKQKLESGATLVVFYEN